MDNRRLDEPSTSFSVIDIEGPAVLSGQNMPETVTTDSFYEFVLRRIRLLSQRRVAWLRKIWTEITAHKKEPFDVHTEVDGYLYDLDIPSAEQDWIANEPSLQKVNEELKEIDALLSRDQSSRLSVLRDIFGLNRIETDLLQACLSITIDPNLARVFAYLQDNAARGYVTEPLVARLFGHGPFLLLDADSPLKKWGLIKETAFSPGEPARIECDPFVRNWLLGQNGADEALNPYLTVQPVKEPLPDWPVQKAADFIQRMVNNDVQNRIRIFVTGAEGAGRRSFAAAVCHKFRVPLLTLHLDPIADAAWPQVYMKAHRLAFLTNAAVAWHGTNIQDRFWPAHIQPFPIQFVIGEADDFLPSTGGLTDLRLEMPAIPADERLQLWRQFVPSATGWKRPEVKELAFRHEATIGQIISIGQKRVATIKEAYEALREQTGHRLGKLAQPMHSSFIWDDLVVPETVGKVLEDFTFEATERVRFWEQPAARRFFPQGRSLIALFTGSPGTGKTMAAQVIATSLKLDLFRIDLSSVVSKYIGESSKNIERILSRAKSMNVVLFFDEADSLFGKRTEIKDAHDRYANTDTNYLLQAIEEYPGTIILASNRKANIDSGFMRRLRYVVDFASPDGAQRLQLWRKIVGGLASEKNVRELDNDLVRLSETVELTGAQIKQAILSALFMARRDKSSLQTAHVLRGLERELAKEGKGLGKQMHQFFNH